MKKIDLNDWEETGRGAFGITYFHKINPTWMLKFVDSSTPIEEVEQEIKTSQEVYELGIPTPKPGELVTDGARTGMVFERIVGKRSFARAVGEEPQRIKEFAIRYAQLVKQLHSTPCNTAKFKNAKEFNKNIILENQFRSNDVKQFAIEKLQIVPDATTCLHGDLHFGNMILTEDKNYFIDLGDFCYGYPLFDLAMQYILPVIVDDARFERDFHCTKAQATLFWNEFLKIYFGPEKDLSNFTKELEPYVLFRLITAETKVGRRLPPDGEILLQKILDGKF